MKHLLESNSRNKQAYEALQFFNEACQVIAGNGDKG